MIARDGDYCVLQLRRQHACGFDYLAQIRYQLLRNQLVAALTLTHCGSTPIPYGCGFHPFFPFDKRGTVQFAAAGYWPEGEQHLLSAGKASCPATPISATRSTVRIAG